MSAHGVDISEHAKRAILSKASRDERRGEIVPIGVGVHLARYPQTCEDCNQTYWTRDEWGNGGHVGCRGTLKKAGF